MIHKGANRDGGAPRLAALDVGSNSIRLIVVEVQGDGNYRLLDDEKEVTRLGAGLAKTGRLSNQSMKASALAIARMKQIAEGYGVKLLRAVATSAVREARNNQVFLRLVRKQARINLEVISADDEARLAFKSVSHSFDLRALNSVIADIGGGSTELVVSVRGAVENIHALKLGAIRLTDLFGAELTDDAYQTLRSRIKRTIKDNVERPKSPPQALFGTGGTFTTLAALAIAQNGTEKGESGSPSVRGFEMKRSEVKHMLDHLRGLSVKARMKIPGMSPERAEIIVAGIAIVDCIMRRLRVNTLRVHDRGIRDGLVLTMIESEFPRLASRGAAQDRMSFVRTFAKSCNYERLHSEHVTKLALTCFDQLALILPDSDLWSAENRNLLESASVLHDIGYYINYAKHHKHSHHLIVHSEMQGFTHRTLSVIGAIARYHRRAEPKKSHPEFQPLCREDRRIVVELASILRIADGLDRTHSQQIRSVALQRRGAEITFDVQSEEEPTVDIWGAMRKCQLFQRAFDLRAVFRWRGQTARPIHPRTNLKSRRPKQLS